MKVCISCGRNNMRWKLVFAGNKCEDCVQGREIKVMQPLHKQIGFKCCSRCGIVQNEINSCLVRGIRFNTYCNMCISEKYKERMLLLRIKNV